MPSSFSSYLRRVAVVARSFACRILSNSLGSCSFIRLVSIYKRGTIRMKRIFHTILVGLFALALIEPVSAQLSVTVSFGPPALPIYDQPICPADGYMWVPGYWAYDPDDGYYWVPGTWVEAPEPGFLW